MAKKSGRRNFLKGTVAGAAALQLKLPSQQPRKSVPPDLLLRLLRLNHLPVWRLLASQAPTLWWTSSSRSA